MNRWSFFILFVLPYFVIAAFFYRFYSHLVIEEAEQQVTAILESTNALRTYIENVQKPVIYKLKKEGHLNPGFFDPKILSASYIANRVLENYIKANNIPYKYKLAATNPRNPRNKADSFEAAILHQFRSGKIHEFSTVLEEDGTQYFFKAIPVGRNTPSCMRCHSTPERAPKELIRLYGPKAGFGEKIGSMRALISLKIPIGRIMGRYQRDFWVSLLILLVLFALFYWFIYIINKKDQKIREERIKRDRMLEEANAQLTQRVEKEIEQRLKQERELSAQERLLTHQSKLASMGEMIGNIAHQWRQPLTELSTVLINLELQQDHNRLTPEVLQKKIAQAQAQVQYMSGTIDDFRHFFAPDKAEESYRISVPIQSVTKLVGASLKNNAINLSVMIEDDFFLTGYPNEVAQALLNIISNAKDALLENKTAHARIVLHARKEAEIKIVTICDNAGGIPPDLIEKIFEPYFSTKHASTGTGVGLYMTKVIIETHNHGVIHAQNDRDGACFTIVFEE